VGAVAKLETPDDSEALVPEPIESEHILTLGDETFECADKLPIRTLVRYADGGLEQIHHILVKLVHEDDVERMWDAFEEMPDDDAAMESINQLISSYADRPTERPSPSRRGSGTTRRK
jgi:hypothetical protein